METGYQRGKIQEESLHYEQKKHDGSYPDRRRQHLPQPPWLGRPRRDRAGPFDRGGEAVATQAAARFPAAQPRRRPALDGPPETDRHRQRQRLRGDGRCGPRIARCSRSARRCMKWAASIGGRCDNCRDARRDPAPGGRAPPRRPPGRSRAVVPRNPAGPAPAAGRQPQSGRVGIERWQLPGCLAVSKSSAGGGTGRGAVLAELRGGLDRRRRDQEGEEASRHAAAAGGGGGCRGAARPAQDGAQGVRPPRISSRQRREAAARRALSGRPVRGGRGAGAALAGARARRRAGLECAVEFAGQSRAFRGRPACRDEGRRTATAKCRCPL